MTSNERQKSEEVKLQNSDCDIKQHSINEPDKKAINEMEIMHKN